MNPGVASFHAFLADMLVGFSDFDLIQVRTLFGHQFLHESSTWNASSDHGHVTKVHQHCKQPRRSLTMISEDLHLCFGSIIYHAF